MMYRQYLRNNPAESRVFMEELVRHLGPGRMHHEQYTMESLGKRGPVTVRISFRYSMHERDDREVRVTIDFTAREIYIEKVIPGPAVTLDELMDGAYAARMIRMLYMRPAEM